MDSRLNYLRAGIAAILTAAAYFYGTGLHPHWYLTWLAPFPILWIGPRSSRWITGLAAFFAFALGGANIIGYMTKVAPLPIILLAILGPALLFAWFVLIYRRFVLRGQLLRAAFTLPTLWVAYEYLNEINSPHSTWGNLAYTQMDNLPILQIASLTGIWSISFLLFLLPSAIASLTTPAALIAPSTEARVPHPWRSSRGPQRRVHVAGVAIGQRVGWQKLGLRSRQSLAIAVTLIFAAVLTYGELRLHAAPQAPAVTIGLLNSDPPYTRFQKGPAAIEVIRSLTARIPALAQQGAQIVVIPEKVIGLDTSNIGPIDQLLTQSAHDNRVTIVIGVLHQPNLNESRVYTPDAGLQATYEKHHMLPIFEGDLLPGTTRTLLQEPFGKAGLTICKDMDFPALSRQYGNDGAGLLLVPAWDFIDDGWQHGRMAILRGVESGFAIARSAKQGILALTDNRGRVIAEKTTGTSEDGFDSLVATLHVHPELTLYDRAGDWFAWLNLALAVFILWTRPSVVRSAA